MSLNHISGPTEGASRASIARWEAAMTYLSSLGATKIHLNLNKVELATITQKEGIKEMHRIYRLHRALRKHREQLVNRTGKAS